jgi:DNA-binding transcriptional regulator YdaS (Cro superfamily)
MSATSVKLLQVALEIVGGSEALARHLGIEDALLATYLADRRPLPDALLLRAVDLIIAERHAPAPVTATRPSDAP